MRTLNTEVYIPGIAVFNSGVRDALAPVTEVGTWKLSSLPCLKRDFVPRRALTGSPARRVARRFSATNDCWRCSGSRNGQRQETGGDCHRDPFAGRLEMQRESLRTRTDSIRRKMIEESWKQQFCSGWLDCSTLKEKAFEQQGAITEIESGGLVQFIFLI